MKTTEISCVVLMIEKGEVHKNLYLEHFVHIASPENLVHTTKLLGFISRKIRSKHTIPRTPPSKKLAGRTWRHGTLFSTTLFHVLKEKQDNVLAL